MFIGISRWRRAQSLSSTIWTVVFLAGGAVGAQTERVLGCGGHKLRAWCGAYSVEQYHQVLFLTACFAGFRGPLVWFGAHAVVETSAGLTIALCLVCLLR